MSQVFTGSIIRKDSKLLADPIGSMLQTFQTLSDENHHFPVCRLKVDNYDQSKIPCLLYETFNKCSMQDCKFLHGQRCPHCYENVLPLWNGALREKHTSNCEIKIKELKQMKRYEPHLSWLHCRAEDDRKNGLCKNQQWY